MLGGGLRNVESLDRAPLDGGVRMQISQPFYFPSTRSDDGLLDITRAGFWSSLVVRVFWDPEMPTEERNRSYDLLPVSFSKDIEMTMNTDSAHFCVAPS